MDVGINAPVYAPTALPPSAVERTRHFWTTRELKLVEQLYPAGGLPACIAALPGRTAGAIYQKAGVLGLLRQGRKPRERRGWSTDEHIDAAIRRVYQSEPTRHAVNDLARRVMRPRWWVSKRARQLGLVAPRFKEPRWTAAEDEIVGQMAHRSPKVIRQALIRAGHPARTETAIVVRRKRLGCSTEDPDHFTATGLAGLMGVDATTVAGWIERGLLAAKRRGTARTARQGGDQWWIHRRAVRRFVVDNVAVVDLRKVDKFWFVDLLAGGSQ